MSGAEVILGVVAGGAGLMSLSIQLAESAIKLKRVYHSMRNAPEALKDVADEIQIMSLSLKHLERHRQYENHGADILHQCIEQCRRHVAQIAHLVEKTTQKLKSGVRTARLYAAAQGRDVERLLVDMNRARAALHLAIELYHQEEQDRRWLSQQNEAARTRDELGRLHQAIQAQNGDIVRHLALFAQQVRPPVTLDQTRCSERSDEPKGDSEVPQAEKELSFRRSKRDLLRKAYRVRLTLPAWFCSKVWDLAYLEAQRGWDICFRTYNMRQPGSEIFQRAGRGDLDGVRRLLQNGEASLFDIDSDEENLLWTSGSSLWVFGPDRTIPLLRWLLAQGLTVARNEERQFVEKTLSLAMPGDCESVWRFFIEEYRLTAHFSDFAGLMRYAGSVRGLEILSAIFREALGQLSALERLHVGAAAFNANDSVALYLRKLDVGRRSPALAHFCLPSGESALHHVARALIRILRFRPNLFDRDSWVKFAVDIIQNNADLHLIRTDRTGSHTPLLELLRSDVTEVHGLHDLSVSALSERLEVWTTMLQMAGVDLHKYFAKEWTLWQTLRSRIPLSPQTLGRSVPELSSITFCSETQLCSIMVYCRVDIPIVQLHRLPGAFDNQACPGQIICWEPDLHEQEEGHWSRKEGVTLYGKEVDVGTLKDEHDGLVKELIDCTQDDNGILARMEQRLSRGDGLSTRRASSQPSPLYRRRYQYENNQQSTVHDWMTGFHFCHATSTWSLSCHTDSEGCFIDPRFCARGISLPPRRPYPECLAGCGFVEESRRCRHGTRFGYPGVDYLTSGVPPPLQHDSTALPCPQHCSRIDFDKLHLPTSLPQWHPGFFYRETQKYQLLSDIDVLSRRSGSANRSEGDDCCSML